MCFGTYDMENILTEIISQDLIAGMSRELRVMLS